MSFLHKVVSLTIAVTISGITSDCTLADTETQLLQQIEQYSHDNRQNQIEQVTNVNQLRDVAPTDWSYEAIRSLSDRYGCISGFPDGTYRGNQPITRYEFAAGLNSCFQQIERSINSASSGVSQDASDKRETIDAQLDKLSGLVDELE